MKKKNRSLNEARDYCFCLLFTYVHAIILELGIRSQIRSVYSSCFLTICAETNSGTIIKICLGTTCCAQSICISFDLTLFYLFLR